MVMIQGESLGQRAGTLPPAHDELEILHEQDDDTLLARLRGGDEVAFRALVDRHRPWLVRLCTRLLGYDAHAAEDAAQESLLKLHRAARDGGRPLRIRPWLTVVARNTCVDEQRRRRPDLPGELPERAAPGDDPFQHDAALTDAWARLAGRHREVLYLREVLGFSYKEIGAVMGLTLPATETLLFRARAALRREYERSGGTSFGCGVLGFHLARLGLERRRNAAVTGGVQELRAAPLGDAGFSGLTSRLGHLLTSLPGCGEQAVAKALSMAAGVAMAAAAVIPGLGPFGGAPRAEAADAPAVIALSGRGDDSSAAGTTGTAGSLVTSAKAATLKTLLGDAVPADWTPRRSRPDSPPTPAVNVPSAPASDPSPVPVTPLRDAAAAARSAERPTLRRGDDSQPGPLRSVLPARPDADRPEPPVQPVRTLLADPVPFLIDALPLDATPVESTPEEPPAAEPPPADPAPGDSLPDNGSRPKVREILEQRKGALRPGGESNVAEHDAALLRRGHR